MKNYLISTIFISFVIVMFFVKFHTFVETTYIINFFSDNVVYLFVSFLFINASALGVVLLEAGELIKNDFITTKQVMISINKQMRLINKQIVLVFIAMCFLIYFDSIFIENNQEYISFLNLFIITFFMYELVILYDTVKSVFIVSKVK